MHLAQNSSEWLRNRCSEREIEKRERERSLIFIKKTLKKFVNELNVWPFRRFLFRIGSSADRRLLLQRSVASLRFQFAKRFRV